MNELTIGWWIIPAFMPTLVFVHAALYYKEDKDTTAYRGAIGITVASFCCALLARIL
jgi:hypothetical protein